MRIVWTTAAALALGMLASAASAANIDFEELTFPEGINHVNGTPPPDAPVGTYPSSFVSGGATFKNEHVIEQFGEFFYRSWNGWAYSRDTDTTTPEFTNEFSAFAGSGAGGSSNYAIAFGTIGTSRALELPPGTSPISVKITNNTYAALTMLNGNQFSRPFGDNPETEPVETNYPDFFKLTIAGLDATDSPAGTPVDFYLADYRFTEDNDDYVRDTWETVDLQSLAVARKLVFSFTSSDNGTFGMNTPAYFALDDLLLTDAPLAGDLDGNGFVGQDDLNIILGHWGEDVTEGDWTFGDPSGDGFVGQDDLNAVLGGWGQGTAPVPIPEPATFVLLGLAGAGLLAMRRRQTK
ncbi:MAG: DUF4465 domain-containing protein [Planctomycetota bacterium]|nr:DUF4465 domain-containing protein [Planctomycetota bacterium]